MIKTHTTRAHKLTSRAHDLHMKKRTISLMVRSFRVNYIVGMR